MIKYDFETSAGFIVNATAKTFQKVLDSELRKNVGVTISQWRVVAALVLYPGLTQKEIADKVGIEGATLVPVIDKMENEGLLKRRADSKDRRVNRIYLTPKADSLWNSMMECALRIRKISTRDIPEDQLKTTLETLRKISQNLVNHFDVDNFLTITKKSKS
ncbi:MAG TPA: MarR family winged helix-turn-helix transcriptional regulator [Candidatus Bathyarchaeia archaeon]|nr:MarR family winged helix-turn-helix transcriptional regulator [Candidatus Bathyarchaeia archaeon]